MNARQQAAKELEAAIQQNDVTYGVIGLGFIGTVFCELLCQQGKSVIGYDRDRRALDRVINKRESPVSDLLRLTTNASDLNTANVIFVAVRLPVSGESIDVEPLREAAEAILINNDRPLLVILVSTLSPGMTRDFAKWLKVDANSTRFVVHSPERLSVGDGWKNLLAMSRVLAGIDEESTSLAMTVLTPVSKSIHCVSQPEVTELSKLVENTFRTVGIAFVAEVSRAANACGISAHEVCLAAASKEHGYFPFFPGTGVGGHCLPNDQQILAKYIADSDSPTPVLDSVIRTTKNMPALVLDRLDFLIDEMGASAMKSMLVVGVGFKPGTADTTNSPAASLIRLARMRKLKISYLDHLVSKFVVDGQDVPAISACDLPQSKFCATVLVSGDATANAEDLSRSARVVLDAGGAGVIQGNVPNLSHL